MSEEPKNDSTVGEIFINSSSLSDSQIKALDQLLQFQCFRLEKKLKSLQVKRKNLSDGKSIYVSLNELISRELIEAAERLSAEDHPVSPIDEEDPSELNKVNNVSFTKTQKEIIRIIDTINSRDEKDDKHVHFVESEEEESHSSNESSEEKEEVFTRKKKRSSTLPNPNQKMNLSGEVQLILHNKGTCKPCAFVYSKKKTCRNGPSCGFCHHEDHSVCPLKRWKKTQRLISSGSLTAEAIAQLKRSDSETP